MEALIIWVNYNQQTPSPHLQIGYKKNTYWMYVLTLPRRDFKLWTILQGNAYRVATFHNATCVMSHQSLSIPLSIFHSVYLCVYVYVCVVGVCICACYLLSCYCFTTPNNDIKMFWVNQFSVRCTLSRSTTV